MNKNSYGHKVIKCLKLLKSSKCGHSLQLPSIHKLSFILSFHNRMNFPDTTKELQTETFIISMILKLKFLEVSMLCILRSFHEIGD